MNSHIARGIYRSVERRLSEIPEIVCQKIICLYKEIVGHARKMLVVYSSTQCSFISVSIVNSHLVQFYLVGYEVHCVIGEGICGVECCHLCLAFVYDKLSCEVDIVECSCKTHITMPLTCYRREEGLRRSMVLYVGDTYPLTNVFELSPSSAIASISIWPRSFIHAASA